MISGESLGNSQNRIGSHYNAQMSTLSHSFFYSILFFLYNIGVLDFDCFINFPFRDSHHQHLVSSFFPSALKEKKIILYNLVFIINIVTFSTAIFLFAFYCWAILLPPLYFRSLISNLVGNILCLPMQLSRNIYTCMQAQLLNHVWLFETPLSVAWCLCTWNFPGENTGVSCYFLFQDSRSFVIVFKNSAILYSLLWIILF